MFQELEDFKFSLKFRLVLHFYTFWFKMPFRISFIPTVKLHSLHIPVYISLVEGLPYGTATHLNCIILSNPCNYYINIAHNFRAFELILCLFYKVLVFFVVSWLSYVVLDCSNLVLFCPVGLHFHYLNPLSRSGLMDVMLLFDPKIRQIS